MEPNAQLKAAYEQDQEDRKHGSLSLYRDAQRIKLVRSLLEQNKLKNAEDYYRAALIMQHGQDSDHYKQAIALAKKAVLLKPNHKQARWLACATEDRYLHSIGRPQVWGTQFVGTFEYSLEPFDRHAKTDQERIANNIPPLQEILRQLRAMNNALTEEQSE
ncbi:hypothetical protein [uncultured Pseudoteredinibacter sp.]|uniref:hypothetical protein n=1 Tax=uncultured Pseudoteredinibacter sp. TaxID=1641701 RepID=UPI002615D276|nr:hypothetical protein [uncultured Pseudoteredinibacter sp.]